MNIKIFFLSLSFFLTGCVLSPPIAQSPQLLSSSHGYVYFDTTKDSSMDSAFQIKSLKDGRTYDFIVRPEIAEHAAGVWVPAGEYEIVGLNDLKLEGYSSISVQSGRITDLGTIVSVSLGEYKSYLLPIKNIDNINKVNRLTNEFKPFLKNQEYLVWSLEKAPKAIEQSSPSAQYGGMIGQVLIDVERSINKPSLNKKIKNADTVEEVINLAKQSAHIITDTPKVGDSGNLYFGAMLGQVRVRKQSGDWDVIDTGRLEQVTAVGVDGSTILAGYIDGDIWKSSDSGRTWKLLYSLSDKSSDIKINRYTLFPVIGVDHVKNKWLFTVIHKDYDSRFMETKRIVIYVADANDFKNINLIRKIDLSPANYVFLHTATYNNNFYINAYPDLLKLDIDSMVWKTINPTFKSNQYQVSPVTGALTVSRAFKLAISTDQGEHWTETIAPSLQSINIVFDSVTKGKAIEWKQGAFSTHMVLRQFNPTESVWENYAEASIGCRKILPNETGEPNFCLMSNGNILDLKGSTWVEEFKVD